MKIAIKLILILGSLVLITSAVLGVIITSFGRNANAVNSDCIIVLGCQVYGTVPSPFLKSRLDESQRLYDEGYGNFIIVSGGKGNGENISEAEAMKAYLILNGIPREKIITEDKSSSTEENIKLSKKKMDEYGLKSAVIVSNRYHLKRSSIIAKRNGIDGSYSGVYVSDYKWNELKGFFREILALLVCYIS